LGPPNSFIPPGPFKKVLKGGFLALNLHGTSFAEAPEIWETVVEKKPLPKVVPEEKTPPGGKIKPFFFSGKK